MLVSRYSGKFPSPALVAVLDFRRGDAAPHCSSRIQPPRLAAKPYICPLKYIIMNGTGFNQTNQSNSERYPTP